MGIYNPGGGSPTAKLGTGQTMYVSPAFTQNSNGYYSTVNNAIASVGAGGIGPYEVVIYPGTYNEDVSGIPLVANMVWTFRGMAGAKEITKIRKWNIGLGTGANTYFVYVSNITFFGGAGYYGAECFTNGVGTMVIQWFDCVFTTSDAARYAFWDNVQNVTGMTRNYFWRCQFYNSAGANNLSYNDNSRHNTFTRWFDCEFNSKAQIQFSSTYIHQQLYMFRCTFQGGGSLSTLASVGGLADLVHFDRCTFESGAYVQCNSSSADQAQHYFSHCIMRNQINNQLYPNCYFKNCVWEFLSGATNDAIFIDTAYSVHRYDNCTVNRGRLKLANTVADTQIKLTNCTFHNPLGTEWCATDPAGAAACRSYNLTTDMPSGAGITVNGANNNINVAI